MRALFCYLFAAATVLYSIVPVLSFEKKSDMSEFTSAINGASRLRYGKRSFDFGYPLKLVFLKIITKLVTITALETLFFGHKKNL
ncbi:hypothetical protein OESDEN_20739 [Oesophagostomum dentatum]|uniref:Uncharacterized protein n=1 Tax=Oesophagostomum dentatum TaxID=61180 RepID=A0A0B1S3W3_OESDE|nr:hypothetical protein OESDEN_20739 [Oesophagostomum dentatum]